jgi:hypothetical protein
MKASVITIMLVAAMLLGANFVHAERSQLESYYIDCITKKIVNCERIASAKNHKSPYMVRLVEMRAAQARFYRKHREELAKEMVARSIGTEQYKIDYFLTTNFQESA